MAYRNKTYVCFDADSDIHYYYLMLAWKQSDRTDFGFYDAHDLNNLRQGSNEATIKRKLYERLRNSKVMIVLIGDHTRYLYRYVRWEIEQAINLQMPIVAVNLSGLRELDEARCPPILRSALAVHVSFNSRIVQHALENWPADHLARMRSGTASACHYRPKTYSDLGLA